MPAPAFKLIDNPHQDIPLVLFVRSHFVGLSDETTQSDLHSPGTVVASMKLAKVLLIEEASLVGLARDFGQSFMGKLKEWRQLAQRVIWSP